jgi:hypothetical protein
VFISKAKKNIYFKGNFYFSALRIDGFIGLLPFGFERLWGGGMGGGVDGYAMN